MCDICHEDCEGIIDKCRQCTFVAHRNCLKRSFAAGVKRCCPQCCILWKFGPDPTVVDIRNRLCDVDYIKASFVFEGARTIVCLIYSIQNGYYLAKLNVETKDLSTEKLFDVDAKNLVIHFCDGGTLSEDGFLDAHCAKIGFRDEDDEIHYWEIVENAKGPTYFFSDITFAHMEHPVKDTQQWVRGNIAVGRYGKDLVFLQNDEINVLSPTQSCTGICGFIPIGERLHAVLFAGKSFQIFDFPYDPSGPSPQPPSTSRWCTVNDPDLNVGREIEYWARSEHFGFRSEICEAVTFQFKEECNLDLYKLRNYLLYNVPTYYGMDEIEGRVLVRLGRNSPYSRC